MPLTLPRTVKGCVYRNALPNCVADAPVYQVVKALLTSIAIAAPSALIPGASVKTNDAPVTSRGVE
jgi:hypothetical protein